MAARVSSIFRNGLFSGKTAIVTGGGTGIGKSIAEELLYLGCNVMIASRKKEKLQKATDSISEKLSKHSNAGKLSFIECNIRKEDEVKELISGTIRQFGAINYLVNNGGGQFVSSAENITLRGWNAVIETNLTGTFLMCKEVYNSWMKEHGGVIVNIIADMWKGMPNMMHSGAARAGVDNLTKTLAIEWAASGVRVNSVCPISSTVCFILSPGASFISGECVTVDSGATLVAPSIPFEVPEHSKLPAYSWDDEDATKSKL